MLIKAEVVRLEGREPKDNAQFVVSNLKGSPRRLYKNDDCGRGEIENRIKELYHGLKLIALDSGDVFRFYGGRDLRVLRVVSATRSSSGISVSNTRTFGS